MKFLQKGIQLLTEKRLKVGDQITIYFAKKEVVYEVLELKDSTKKEDATKMFKVLSEKVRVE